MRISDWSSDVCSSDLDVRTLATYKDAGGWLDGKPAIVTRKVGRGSITYVGAWLEPDAMATLAASLLADAKVGPIVADADRKRVVEGKSVSGRVDLGGRGIIQKTKNTSQNNKSK